jgi:hypothetical protein
MPAIARGRAVSRASIERRLSLHGTRWCRGATHARAKRAAPGTMTLKSRSSVHSFEPMASRSDRAPRAPNGIDLGCAPSMRPIPLTPTTDVRYPRASLRTACSRRGRCAFASIDRDEVLPTGCGESVRFLPGGTKNAFSLAKRSFGRARNGALARFCRCNDARLRAPTRAPLDLSAAVAVTPAFAPRRTSFSKHLKKDEESPVGAGPEVRGGARMIWGCFVEAPQKECGWRTAKVASEPSES